MTVTDFSFHKRMQIPTRIRDVGCNFRGSNTLPEVMDPRSRTGDLMHPLRFAHEDTKSWEGMGSCWQGKASVEAFLLKSSQTTATREPYRKKTHWAEEFSVAHVSKGLPNNVLTVSSINKLNSKARSEPIHLNVLTSQAICL